MELLDINGMYQWDNTIFDNMVLPTDIVRSDLIDMIILDCRELTVSIISPSILKRAIELWSKKNIYYWEELQKTMHYTYNPIENYDKHSTITNAYGSTFTDKQTGDLTDTTTGSKTTTDALTVSAFNSSSLEPRETHTITEDYGVTGIVNKTVPNTTNTNTRAGTDTITDETHGNIGTVTTQDMIKQQRETIDISLYNVIINSFKNEFCLLKY